MAELPKSCAHVSVAPIVLDQTLGVECLGCGALLGHCWSGEHISEALWNRAAAEWEDAVPCEESRDTVCAVCRQEIA